MPGIGAAKARRLAVHAAEFRMHVARWFERDQRASCFEPHPHPTPARVQRKRVRVCSPLLFPRKLLLVIHDTGRSGTSERRPCCNQLVECDCAMGLRAMPPAPTNRPQ